MNLRTLDLNLLVILDVLLEEAHVSRAAERLALSQPATSAALERCRGIFGDGLLERRGGTMKLTSKAEALREPLRMILGGVTELIEPTETALASIDRVVRLIMSDYPAVVLIRKLLPQLRATAPGIDLVFLPWHGGSDAAERLRRQQADVAVSVMSADDGDIRSSQLLYETYRIVMRQGHPAAANFDLEQWLTYPHVVVSGRGERRTPLDDALLGIGRQRRVGIVVPSFIMAAPILVTSDLMAMLPTRCIPDGDSFVAVEPPLPVAGFPMHVAWHRRADGDIAIQHVCGLIRDLFI